jgi:hypothetical protein
MLFFAFRPWPFSKQWLRRSSLIQRHSGINFHERSPEQKLVTGYAFNYWEPFSKAATEKEFFTTKTLRYKEEKDVVLLGLLM